jgi:hypothetical protein
MGLSYNNQARPDVEGRRRRRNRRHGPCRLDGPVHEMLRDKLVEGGAAVAVSVCVRQPACRRACTQRRAKLGMPQRQEPGLHGAPHVRERVLSACHNLLGHREHAIAIAVGVGKRLGSRDRVRASTRVPDQHSCSHTAAAPGAIECVPFEDRRVPVSGLLSRPCVVHLCSSSLRAMSNRDHNQAMTLLHMQPARLDPRKRPGSTEAVL